MKLHRSQRRCRTVVAQPARPPAFGKHLAGGACQRPRGVSAYGGLHGVRTSSQSGGLAKATVEDGALSTPNTADLRPGAPRNVRRTVVATARPSISARQTPCGRSVPAASGRGSVRRASWRTNVLAVGRFGGEHGRALECLIRQTRPTYGPERHATFVGRSWRSPPVHQRRANTLRAERVSGLGACQRPRSVSAASERVSGLGAGQRTAGSVAYERPRSRAVWRRAR